MYWYPWDDAKQESWVRPMPKYPYVINLNNNPMTTYRSRMHQEDLAKHLGMDRDEILRLKQITGLAALFREVPFGKAWIPVEDPLEPSDEGEDCPEIEEEI